MIGLLVANAAMDLVFIPLDLWELSIYERAESPDAFLDDTLQSDAEAMGVAMGGAAVLMLLIFLVTVVCFCFLTYRAGANAHRLARGLEHDAGWAVGWYFIPILNLVRPYQAMAEFFRASRPRSEGGVPERWQDNAVPGLLGVWWGLWIVAGLLGQIAGRLAMQEPVGRDFTVAKLACYLSVAESLVGIAAAAAAIWMFRTLFHWQSERREEKRFERDEEAARLTASGYALADTCRECGEALVAGGIGEADPANCPMCGAERPARREPTPVA
ncbi:DUF4328 domain-containing protein [Alienimonas chondri]|uniref:DUF4328 domain-containing protein n=1 Tax=Alienimonas chondri TaxID=2681879 RepID=A0ABX1V9E0_9PLAN|nr:DUF4328 domain-containing protein [Alienimonas chondri]NNJ24688.1 hypothetical protein [Alienimonas chondri]